MGELWNNEGLLALTSFITAPTGAHDYEHMFLWDCFEETDDEIGSFG